MRKLTLQLGNVTIETIPALAGSSTPSAEEMKIARQVQARLLCRGFPQMENLGCSGCYLPAGGIGGDYYDFIHLKDDVTLLVARLIEPR